MSREEEEFMRRGAGSYLCSSGNSFFEKELERRKRKRLRDKKAEAWTRDKLFSLRNTRPSDFLE